MKFAIIGVGGYVAPRHLEAIYANGGRCVAALDPCDSVGILDRYDYDTKFFTEFERFDRHLEKLAIRGDGVDYVSICSPNYLHDAHCRLALRVGAHAICEKPLVINPWNLQALKECETNKRVFGIMQLRLHPTIIKLKERIDNSIMHEVRLTYIASRGNWYHRSWKGDEEKSGGLITNLGIHFLDMLQWIFGPYEICSLIDMDREFVHGYIALKKANVKFVLSSDRSKLPSTGITSYRSLTIDGEEIEFSNGFEDLHTLSYREIIEGRGFTIDDAAPSIELAHLLRRSIIG